MRRPLALRLAVGGLAVAIALTGCEGRERNERDFRTSRVAAQQPATGEAGRQLDNSRRTAIVEAVTEVAPAVVSISATMRRAAESRSPFDFFFVPRAQDQVVQSNGTGFILRDNGIVVTNQHVVAGADPIVVTLSDGTDLPARILGEDPVTDIAVLKVNRTGLPTVTIGDSDDLMIGEWVVALGNPFAYLLGNTEPTVTAGVVSALGRNILPNRDQTGLYLDMIQTDAAINPGNSGGPLVNALGEVVGVNSSIFTRSGGSIGLGFAIPIERAVRVANEIVKEGHVRRAWVGLGVAGPEGLEDWRTQGGVRVIQVTPSSPAESAGISAGTILVSANGEQLRNFLDWEAAKLDLGVGEPLRLTIREGDETRNTTLTTASLPTVSAERVNVLEGLDLITVTPAITGERGLRSDQGALIIGIAPDIARSTGLREGDVIVAINRTLIDSAGQVDEIFDHVSPRQMIRVHIERDRQYAFTDLAFR